MPFPTTPILDNFNRANENPVTGWTDVIGGMQIVSNAITGDSPGFFCAASYNTTMTVPMEFYITAVNEIGTGAVPQWHYLTVWDAVNGFRGYDIIPNIPDSASFFIRRDDIGSNTTMVTATVTGGNLTNGDSFGVQVLTSGDHLVWYKRAAGSWVQVGAFKDATYTSGKCFLQTDSVATGIFDDFGGGQMPEKQSYYVSRRRSSRRGR